MCSYTRSMWRILSSVTSDFLNKADNSALEACDLDFEARQFSLYVDDFVTEA